jgi:hypothetical protein
MNSPKVKIEKIKDYFCIKPKILQKQNKIKNKSAHKRIVKIYDEIESKDILIKNNNLKIKKINLYKSKNSKELAKSQKLSKSSI